MRQIVETGTVKSFSGKYGFVSIPGMGDVLIHMNRCCRISDRGAITTDPYDRIPQKGDKILLVLNTAASRLRADRWGFRPKGKPVTAIKCSPETPLILAVPENTKPAKKELTEDEEFDMLVKNAGGRNVRIPRWERLQTC